MLAPCLSACQGILAGQTSGANVIYLDIDDLLISAPYWNSSEYEYLDLDGDESNDIYFSAEWIYYSHTSYETTRTEAGPLGLLQISTLADHPTWTRMHTSGNLINRTLQWTSAITTLYSQSTGTTSQGIFLGEGYLAFRICSPDTLYGWIRIWNTSTSPSISVYEYAYVTNFVGTLEGGLTADGNAIRVEGNVLKLSISENNTVSSYLITLCDLSGRLIYHATLKPGQHTITLNGCHRGFYLLTLSDDHGGTIVKKIML
jgi:hypothetical protein